MAVIFFAPALIIPPEKPAIVRASDLKGLPSWQEMQRRERALKEGTFPFPVFCPKSVTPYSFNYISDAHSTTTTASLDFTSQSIGTADSTRVVIVGVVMGNGSANTTTVSSVTVNGVSATRRVVAQKDSSTVNVVETSIWTASVPTGTSVTINVTTSATLGAVNYRQIYVYSMLGAAHEAPSSTATAIGTTNPSTTINCPANGNIVAVGGYENSSNEAGASASKAFVASQTGYAVSFSGSAQTLTWTGLTQDATLADSPNISGSDRSALVAASFPS